VRIIFELLKMLFDDLGIPPPIRFGFIKFISSPIWHVALLPRLARAYLLWFFQTDRDIFTRDSVYFFSLPRRTYVRVASSVFRSTVDQIAHSYQMMTLKKISTGSTGSAQSTSSSAAEEATKGAFLLESRVRLWF
jgi:hypothetical protein